MNTIASKRRSILAAALVSITALAAAASTQAATITWGAATNIAGDTDVSTNGSLVTAYDVGILGVAGTTINGVTFNPFAIDPAGTLSETVGNFTLASNPFGLAGNNSVGGSPSNPYASLPGAYKTLLDSFASTAAPSGSMTLTMTGLTVGQTYEFQWWANLSLDPTHSGSTTATAGNAVTLSWNVTTSIGGTGQFAIGTFIADNASQDIVFSNAGNRALVNGFQLRELSAPVSAVPEPGSALIGAMLLGLCGTRLGQRQRAAKS